MYRITIVIVLLISCARVEKEICSEIELAKITHIESEGNEFVNEGLKFYYLIKTDEFDFASNSMYINYSETEMVNKEKYKITFSRTPIDQDSLVWHLQYAYWSGPYQNVEKMSMDLILDECVCRIPKSEDFVICRSSEFKECPRNRIYHLKGI